MRNGVRTPCASWKDESEKFRNALICRSPFYSFPACFPCSGHVLEMQKAPAGDSLTGRRSPALIHAASSSTQRYEKQTMICYALESL